MMVPFFVPLADFQTPAVWYFLIGGIFAPALGRILNFTGIEKIGVARSVSITNTSPIFASILAVLIVGEAWTLQNVFGTSLVVLGIVMLSRTRTERAQWRKLDLIYPALGALSFGIASNLRKLGLQVQNLPLMASVVTATTAVLFAFGVVQARGGRQVLAVSRTSLGWFLASGLTNTVGMLSGFYALSVGKIVIVDPLIGTNPVFSILLTAIFLRDLEVITLRVMMGGVCTVIGSIFVMTV